jgi:uncharacterized protein
MSAQPLVDPEKLVRGGETLTGVIRMAELPELADRLASSEGTLAWQIRAERDLHGRPRLLLHLEARLLLVCQRCLGPLPHVLDHAHALVVVTSEEALPELEDEEEDADCILVPGPLDVRGVVVEELLLALPMMPRHEAPDCVGPEEAGGSTKLSPFAVLRQSGKN